VVTGRNHVDGYVDIWPFCTRGGHGRCTSLHLGAYTPADRELTLAEMTRRTGIPKPTVHRLAGELLALGLPHRPQDLWHYDGRAHLGNMACRLLYMKVPMAIRPHDVTDLYLAPVVLAVDARIEKLGQLGKDGLAYEVALDSDSPDFTRRIREDGLIRTVTHLIDCHGWEFSWDPRGLRLTHDAHTFVLGIPAVFLEYLKDSPGV